MKRSSRNSRRPKRRKLTHRPIGAVPGTVVSPPDALPTQIDVVGIRADDIVEHRQVSIADLHRLRKEWPLIWVNLTGLGSVDQLKQVGGIFGIHGLSLEDATTLAQRAKAERYETYYYISCRMLEFDAYLKWEQLSLFLGSGFVITIQERPGDCFEPVRKRLRQGSGRIRKAGADYLAYALLDAVVDSYYPIQEHFGETLDALESEVLSGASSEDMMQRIRSTRHDLLLLKRTISPLRDAVAQLQRTDTPLIDQATQPYLRDCHDHLLQLVDILETHRELSSTLLDVYLSTLNYRAAEVGRVLTVVATIFIPLTFIAGVYGMNFSNATSPYNMPELQWAWGYPSCLALMATVAIAMVIFFIRKGWLGRR